jgi:hypothetical protein
MGILDKFATNALGVVGEELVQIGNEGIEAQKQATLALVKSREFQERLQLEFGAKTAQHRENRLFDLANPEPTKPQSELGRFRQFGSQLLDTTTGTVRPGPVDIESIRIKAIDSYLAEKGVVPNDEQLRERMKLFMPAERAAPSGGGILEKATGAKGKSEPLVQSVTNLTDEMKRTIKNAGKRGLLARNKDGSAKIFFEQGGEFFAKDP